MSRGRSTSIWRPAAVWAIATTAAGGTWICASTSVMALASEQVWTGAFEDLLVAVAAAVLVVATTWLWVVTTTTVVTVVAGRPAPAHGLTRRLVLVACGAAVVAGVSSPALAGGGTDGPGLAGLPFPDRAVAGARPAPAPPAERVAVRSPAVRPVPSSNPPTRHRSITVRPGDSLWSIAQADLAPDAATDEIDEAWRALYAANREAIGPDPDLIRPGQRLRTDHAPVSDTAPASDTDR